MFVEVNKSLYIKYCLTHAEFDFVDHYLKTM